jgi:hypothetical protein
MRAADAAHAAAVLAAQEGVRAARQLRLDEARAVRVRVHAARVHGAARHAHEARRQRGGGDSGDRGGDEKLQHLKGEGGRSHTSLLQLTTKGGRR